jgi:hypothetical protein
MQRFCLEKLLLTEQPKDMGRQSPHIVRPFDAVGCVLEVSEALERNNYDAEVRWEL